MRWFSGLNREPPLFAFDECNFFVILICMETTMPVAQHDDPMARDEWCEIDYEGPAFRPYYGGLVWIEDCGGEPHVAVADAKGNVATYLHQSFLQHLIEEMGGDEEVPASMETVHTRLRRAELARGRYSAAASDLLLRYVDLIYDIHEMRKRDAKSFQRGLADIYRCLQFGAGPLREMSLYLEHADPLDALFGILNSAHSLPMMSIADIEDPRTP
jgi:hypothetical protein